MDAVHVDEGGGDAAAQAVGRPLDAFFEHVVVPVAEAGFATQDQHDRGVDELEGFGPLGGFLGVVLFGRLLDLPGAPGLVAECPVLDLLVISVCSWTSRVAVSPIHCMAYRGRSCGACSHSMCSCRSCNIRAIP